MGAVSWRMQWNADYLPCWFSGKGLIAYVCGPYGRGPRAGSTVAPSILVIVVNGASQVGGSGPGRP